MVLNMGHPDLSNTILQCIILIWFKIVFLDQASEASGIPFPIPTLV